jgi:hypothetical protein
VIGDDEQQVVAFFTGHVEFSYLGYQMSADEVRYNQATEVATISGAVEVWLPDENGEVETRFNCIELIINGEQGHGAIPGAFQGSLNYGRTALVAGSAEFGFPPGQAVSSAAELSLTLKDGVSVSSPDDGMTFTTGSAMYEGASGKLSAPGQIALVGTDAAEDSPAGETTVWLTVQAGGLTGQVDPADGVRWVELSSVNAEFIGGWLSAGTTRLEPLASNDSSGVLGASAWRVEMINGPVTGALMQEDGILEVSAEQIGGSIDRSGIREIELTGQASVKRGDFELYSSQIVVKRHARNSYSFTAPELTEARFDFAQLSSSDPLSIETIQSWLD